MGDSLVDLGLVCLNSGNGASVAQGETEPEMLRKSEMQVEQEVPHSVDETWRWRRLKKQI